MISNDLSGRINALVNWVLDDNKWLNWNNLRFIKSKHLYIRYSKALESSQTLVSFCSTLESMLKEGLYPDKFILVQMIKRFGQMDVRIALSLLAVAERFKLVNEFTYYSTIDAISKCHLPDIKGLLEIVAHAHERGMADSFVYSKALNTLTKSTRPDANSALKLFEQAKTLGVLDEYIFTCAIDVIAKDRNQSPIKAIQLLKQASELGMANARTYGCTLNALANRPNPDVGLAIELLNESKTKSLADKLIYNSVITILVKANQLEKARQYFDEGIETHYLSIPIAHHDTHRGQKILVIDLHGYNYGTAYIGLIAALNKIKTKSDISIIYGKGSHHKLYKNTSKSDQTHELKQAVTRVLEEMGIKGQVNTYNSGMIDIQIEGTRKNSLKDCNGHTTFFPKLTYKPKDQTQFSTNLDPNNSNSSF